MTDVEFGAVIYRLNKWADEANVLVVMACHLRKQARDATKNNVRIGDMYGSWQSDKDVPVMRDGTAWDVDDNDASDDTHLMHSLPEGRFS